MRAPVVAICHGGGPMPLLNDPDHKEIIHSLRNRVPSILNLKSDRQPRAILLFSAHWETEQVTISSGSKPKLYYDYFGFPPETYQIKHDAPGDPEVARLVSKTLADAGIQSVLDAQRGWDHGVFVPMKLINPAADIPIISMSVLASQSAHDLFRIGQALEPLRDQNIAILGSGFASYHNLRDMFSGATSVPGFKGKHGEWASAIDDAMATRNVEERAAKLDGWRKWPHANAMHPMGAAEHFSPLVVCAGAAGEQVPESWTDEFLGFDNKSYYWK